MRIAFSYPVPLQTEENWQVFKPGVERFAATWKQFPQQVPVTVFAVCMDNDATQDVKDILGGLPVEYVTYHGKGLDCRACQWLAPTLDNYFLIGMPTRTHFHREGAARELMIARERHGPGLYGTSWSVEARPHVRTCFYGIDANYLRLYPVAIDSPESGTQFEIGNQIGQLSLYNWAQSVGIVPRMVYWSGVKTYPGEWPVPNGFRCGDQSDLLVWDKQTDAYQNADAAEKERLHALAFGLANLSCPS